jgi:hypothetical protein
MLLAQIAQIALFVPLMVFGVSWVIASPTV